MSQVTVTQSPCQMNVTLLRCTNTTIYRVFHPKDASKTHESHSKFAETLLALRTMKVALINVHFVSGRALT
jgi:hypothetical protein